MVQLSPAMDNLSKVMDFLGNALDNESCSMKVRLALETVVEEAFVNIVEYSHATTLEFGIQTQENEITLTFADDGIPFNPLSMKDPDITLPAEERRIGGLGVLIMKKMTDRQSYVYRDGMNRLTLEKRLV